MNKVVFWDFDGTLIPHTIWRLGIMQVLDEHEPGHNIDSEMMRPLLRNGFPWHKPEEPHLQLNNPDAWWRALEPVFIKCYTGVGYPEKRAAVLATLVRKYMIRPERYTLFEDALPVLAELKEKGWRNVILSNHMPELPVIVNALGLSPYIESCINSAATGYEKPNPQAFHIALASSGNPEKVWMVGDNIVSDIKGAEAVGISSILVHVPRPEDIKYYAANLIDVVKIIQENSF